MKVDTKSFIVPPSKKIKLDKWATLTKPLYGSKQEYKDLLDAQVAALSEQPREDVPGEVFFGEEQWTAGVKLKGNRSFRDLSEKSSFKIDFHEYDEDARFYGRKRITLNNMIQDPTMSSENLSYALHAAMGHAAPLHGYARVTVNGELFGLYSLLETVDDDFLERNFPGDDEGNLYEGGYGGDFNNGCESLFEQDEGDDTSLADLRGLIAEVEASTPETIEALIDARFDAEALFAMWGVEIVSGNADGYTSLGNNFHAYHAVETAQWTLIPWGADQAFRADSVQLSDFYGALAVRCWASTGCQARMRAGVERVVETWRSEDFGSFALEEIDRIETDCREDPRSEWGDYGCRDQLVLLRDWVAGRADAVTEALAGQ